MARDGWSAISVSAALAGLGLFAGCVFWLGTMQATLDALNAEAI